MLSFLFRITPISHSSWYLFLLILYFLPTSHVPISNFKRPFSLILESKMIKFSTIIRSSHLAKSRKIYCSRIRFVGRIECFLDSAKDLMDNFSIGICTPKYYLQRNYKLESKLLTSRDMQCLANSLNTLPTPQLCINKLRKRNIR